MLILCEIMFQVKTMRMHSCVLTGSRKCLKVRMGHVRPIPTGASSPPPWGLLKVNQKNLVRFLSVFLFSKARFTVGLSIIALKRQIRPCPFLKDQFLSFHADSTNSSVQHFHLVEEIVLEIILVSLFK